MSLLHTYSSLTSPTFNTFTGRALSIYHIDGVSCTRKSVSSLTYSSPTFTVSGRALSIVDNFAYITRKDCGKRKTIDRRLFTASPHKRLLSHMLPFMWFRFVTRRSSSL